MDRLAAHFVAMAVLTVALAAIPTAMAQPTSSQSAAAASSAPAQTSISPAAPRASGSAQARGEHNRPEIALPPGCPDAFQVGPAAYARWHGAIAFSVKQFYSPSCHARFGYARAWRRFRDQRVSYDLGIAGFDATHDAIDGARTYVGATGGPDYWSDPVSVPAGTCTEGLAHVFFPDDETDTFTSEFCG